MMAWFRVDKAATAVPAAGSYKSWKGDLRIEGKYQCVYCAIGEPLFGGERNFHVEHYRPKKLFDDLVNAFSNLFYCCAICNSFKGSDWPEDPLEDLSNSAYPDPSATDYSEVLSVDGGVVSSQVVAGKYLIERLNLNRAQLVMIRRFVFVRDQILGLTAEVERAAAECQDVNAMREGIRCLAEAVGFLDSFTRAIPYEPADARR